MYVCTELLNENDVWMVYVIEMGKYVFDMIVEMLRNRCMKAFIGNFNTLNENMSSFFTLTTIECSD